MAALPVHRCECEKCRSRAPHPERTLHRQINLLASRLDEQQRRWFVSRLKRRELAVAGSKCLR